MHRLLFLKKKLMEYIKHSWLKNVTLNVRESMHDGRQLHVEFMQPRKLIHTESVLESVFPVSFAFVLYFHS